MSRKPLYFIINGIFPAIVLNVVNFISFFLPFTEQIALTITCFLTFSVNLVIVSADIPVQSDNIPTITMYFIFSIIYTLVTLFWFAFLNYFSTRNFLPFYLSFVARFPENLINLCFNKKKRTNISTERNDDDKVEFEKIKTRLNYYFLILFFIFMLASQLWIWLSIN